MINKYYLDDGSELNDMSLSKRKIGSLKNNELHTAIEYYWERALNPNDNGDCSADILLINSEITSRYQKKLNYVFIVLTGISIFTSIVATYISILSYLK